MSLGELLNRYNGERDAFQARVGEAMAAQERVQALDAKVTSAKSLADTYEQVGALFQHYADNEHEELRVRIEALVTTGLATVFDEGLRFKLTPSVERGQAAIRFTVVSAIDGVDVETDVVDARGGGLVAVIGFVLRAVVLALDPGNLRPFLFLDETFGQLSRDYGTAMSQLLRMLADDLNLQIVLVTHQPEQAALADVAYEFDHDGSRTIIGP